MSHMNGGLPPYGEAGMATGSDPYGHRDTEADNPLRDHIRFTRRRRRSSVDSLTQAQRVLSEKEVPDIYSQSDARVVRGWKDRTSRPRISQQHVHPGTLPARPHDRFAGTPGLLRPPFMDVSPVDSPPECHVCYEAFTDEVPCLVPRNLQCGHSFCTGCLRNLLERSITSSSVVCPKCLLPTLVPDRNIDKLARNFALMEVIRSLPRSRSCSPPEVRPHQPEATVPTVVIPKCTDHGDHLTSYCVNDNKLICSTCLVYGSHVGHKTLGIKEAAAESRRKLLDLNPDVLHQCKRMEKSAVEVEAMCEAVEKTGGEVVDRIEEAFRELCGLIEERKNRMKIEAMQRTQIRMKALKEQARDLHESIEKSKAVHSKVKQVIEKDDHSLLQEMLLTMDQIEGVFINPPPTQPRAGDDLRCRFSPDPKDEIAALVAEYGTVSSEVGSISNLRADAYHDGIRISWLGHDRADNHGISYHLQMATHEDSGYVMIYRGSSTKYTWKTDLDYNVYYRFRVQVRTTEGVGCWSDPVTAKKAPPGFHWHEKWRNVKIELSPDKLEASWLKGAHHRYWATFAADKILDQTRQHYAEVEVVEFGKQKPQKKLAIGVVSCGKRSASGLPWHDGQRPVGQMENVKSWSFHPISGVKNSYDSPNESKPYAENISLQEGDKIGMLIDGPAKKLTFFLNGQDLGVAFEDIDTTALLPVVSIRDKIRVRLRFPPPPYSKRSVKLIRLRASMAIDY